MNLVRDMGVQSTAFDRVVEQEKVIEQLEKNEAIDKKLLRNLTVRVKKFDLENNYFSKKEELENSEKKEKTKN